MAPSDIVIISLLAYLSGSIPTGYLVAKAKGIDIRAIGSGNIGATNVFRHLGRSAGVFVLLVDAAKGYLPCVFLPSWCAGPVGADSMEVARIAAAIGAVLGHNYTLWLGFKGGKGIATSAGVLLALLPKALLGAVLAWLITFALSRYVSLASVASAVALPIAAWWTGSSSMLIGVCLTLSTLAIYKHRANIQRLMAGTEHRFGAKKATEGAKP